MITFQNIKGLRGKHTDWLAADERIARESLRTTTDGIVVDDRASSSHTACSRTWIPAFLISTRLILGTLSAHNALWATGRRTSNESWNTRANCLPVDFPTLTVWSTWRGVARISNDRRLLWSALYKCVSCHSVWASTHWNVVDDFTHGVLSACSWTRIDTFATNTGLISSAVRVQDTLWSASTVRISLIFGKTCADTVLTLRIRSTRRWIARIVIYGLWCC